MRRIIPVNVLSVVACLAGIAATHPSRAQSVTPDFEDFGPVPVGQVSAPRVFTLDNPSAAQIEVTQLFFDGPDAARFAVAANTCTQPLPPQAECEVSVTFAPTQAGAAAGILVLVVTDGHGDDSRVGANLAGTGTGVPPGADLSVGVVVDDDTVLPGAAMTATATVENLGPADATDVVVEVSFQHTPTTLLPAGEGWACQASGIKSVLCSRPALAAGAAAQVTVGFGAPLPAGDWPVFAFVQGEPTDPALANNEDSTTFSVDAPLAPGPVPTAAVIPALDGRALALLVAAVLLLATGWSRRH